MRTNKIIHIVNCHAEGEVGNVIVGGVTPPPGSTLWEQAQFIARDKTLRRFVLNEPRGGVYKHFILLVPPKDPRAAYGFIIMEPEHTPPMSGSNSICTATVLLDTGMVRMVEPETAFYMEAPGGLVHVRAFCEHGKAQSVEIENVPSFAAQLDVTLEVPRVGTLIVDTAYGGDSFVVVKAQELGFEIVPSEARDLATMGVKITKAANEQLGFVHPENTDWQHISFCQIALPVERVNGILTAKSTSVIDPGKLDRSPTGTGCSARMAILYARGEMAIGEQFIGRSIINSQFHCRILRETIVGNKLAVVPTVRGRAWITGTQQLMCDPDDPYPLGYRLSDTWPMMV